MRLLAGLVAGFMMIAGVGTTVWAEETAPAAAAAETKSAPAERPLDNQLTSLEEGVARLSGDTVKLKIGFLFQGGWLNDDAGFSVGGPPTNGISVTSGNQFFVRRARFYFNGQLSEKVGFKVSLEPAIYSGTTGGGSQILRDAFIWGDYIPYARITLGQFKVPYGLEGVESIGDNPTINRSMATNFIHYPTLRDLGVMASGSYKTKVSRMPLGVSYWAAIVNGTGYNLQDDNNYKDFAARVVVNPLVEGLNVGASYYTGETRSVSGTGAGHDHDRNRWAVELDYNCPKIKGLKLRGEFLYDSKYFDTFASKNKTVTTGLPAYDGWAHSYGWYLLGAYRIDGQNGVLGYFNGLEPLIRYDYMDENSDTPGNVRYRTTLGVNYYMGKYTRLMVNYEIIHASSGLSTASLEKIDTVSHNLFTVMGQVKF